jgi:hypothetical protein
MSIDPAISTPQVGFDAQLRHVLRHVRGTGTTVADMRRAGALELQGGLSAIDLNDSGDPARAIDIHHLEGPFSQLRLPKPTAPSRLRYFLDGTQRTFPVFRIGYIPVYVTLSAAAIGVRDSIGDLRIWDHALTTALTWIVPETCGDPAIATAAAALREAGASVVDPFDRLEPRARADAAGDYGYVERQALQVARARRETIERDLLHRWAAAPTGDDWIVVDGALRAPVPRAVGLVKSFSVQYVRGQDALALFTLPEGARTTAFRAINRWRDPSAPDETDERTLWFLRFRDADGRDARHALVRLETEPAYAATPDLDRLSSWVLAERRPSPTADARWDSLIYPIHLLERIIKTRVDREASAWPGDRQRG